MSYSGAVLAAAPVHFYALEETSGTSAADTGSGTPTAATYVNTPSLAQTGRDGGTSKAVLVDHLNSEDITVPLALTPPFSVGLWFKWTGQIVLARDDSNTGSTLLLLHNSSGTTLQCRMGGVTVTLSGVTTTSIRDGNWHHLVITRATASAGVTTARCYIDGTLVGSAQPTANTASSSPLHFGRNGSNSGTSNFADATFDLIGIWNRELSSAEVTALFLGAEGTLFPPLLDVAPTLYSPDPRSPLTRTQFFGADGGVVDSGLFTTGTGGLGGGTVTVQSSIKYQGDYAYFLPTGSGGMLRDFADFLDTTKRYTIRFRCRIESLPAADFALVQSWAITSGVWQSRGNILITTAGKLSFGGLSAFTITPGAWFTVELQIGDPTTSTRVRCRVNDEVLGGTSFSAVGSIGIGHPSSAAPDMYLDTIEVGNGGAAGNWFPTTMYPPLLDVAPTLYAPTVTDYEAQDPGTVDDPITGTVYISGESVRSVTEVRLYVQHSNTGHLLVTLKPPDGSPEVTLFDHRGSGADIGASSASPLILRDDASTTLASSFTSGTGLTRKPEQPLSTFKNESGGTWVITVTDTTTSTQVVLPYARIDTTGPKAQKKILKPKLATYNPTLYTPSVTQSGATLYTPLLDVAPTLLAPTVIGPQTLTSPLLTVAPTLFAPELRHVLRVPLLTVAPDLISPAVIGPQTLGPVPLLTVTPVLFGPSVNPRAVTVSLPLLTVDPSLYSPTLIQRIVVPLLSVDPDLYGPGLTLRAVELLLPLLAVDPELLAPTVHQRLVLPLMDLDILTLEPRLIAPRVFKVFPPSRPGFERAIPHPGWSQKVG